MARMLVDFQSFRQGTKRSPISGKYWLNLWIAELLTSISLATELLNLNHETPLQKHWIMLPTYTKSKVSIWLNRAMEELCRCFLLIKENNSLKSSDINPLSESCSVASSKSSRRKRSISKHKSKTCQTSPTATSTCYQLLLNNESKAEQFPSRPYWLKGN